MKPVVFAPAARADLHAIALYIANDNPDRAVSFVADLEALSATIGERPSSFPAKDEIGPGLRGAVHGRYLILFRDLPGAVRIVRVLHSARDAVTISRQGGLK